MQEEIEEMLEGPVLKLKEPNAVRWLSLHGRLQHSSRVLPAVIATLENDASDTSLDSTARAKARASMYR